MGSQLTYLLETANAGVSVTPLLVITVSRERDLGRRVEEVLLLLCGIVLHRLAGKSSESWVAAVLYQRVFRVPVLRIHLTAPEMKKRRNPEDARDSHRHGVVSRRLLCRQRRDGEGTKAEQYIFVHIQNTRERLIIHFLLPAKNGGIDETYYAACKAEYQLFSKSNSQLTYSILL